MNKEHFKEISSQFSKSDYEIVVSEMESITLDYVMASSQVNLDNTWSAILELSKGNLSKLGELVNAAKIDFRDVIYWATLEKDETT
jgi:hypothetical protein